MTTLKELKTFSAKLSGVEPADVDARAIAKAIRWITHHLPHISVDRDQPHRASLGQVKEKQAYTAAEVGILPADTTIPSGAQLLYNKIMLLSTYCCLTEFDFKHILIAKGADQYGCDSPKP